MTDRTTFVSVSDGDQLSEGYFNGITRVNRKVFTDTTEHTHTGDTDWTNAGSSFTITSGLNKLILGIYLQTQLKTDNASHIASACLKITGSNLGTKYLSSVSLRTGADESKDCGLVDTEAALVISHSTSYATCGASAFIPLKLLDATTTFQVRIHIADAGATVSIDETSIEIVYVNTFTDD